jgi:hypothetical protein
MSTIKQIHIGEKFGRLTLMEEVESLYNNKIRRFLCECDCGNKKLIHLTNLKSGDTKSCGCLNIEISKQRNRTHGDSNSPEYQTWKRMKRRCDNPKGNRWEHYGGRGIKVCDRWINSYQNFLEDMGRKPSPEYSIDRINVNGNYEPSNCRWSTPKEQSNNTRRNKNYGK